ncbi:hypothetical protein ACTG9Q_32410 [Actinokineospora sp. 24-640]
MTGRRRAMWLGVGCAVAGVAMWALARFGLLDWVGDERHPARAAVEALSWVAGIGGLVVGMAALVVATRSPASSGPSVSGSTIHGPTLVAGGDIRDVTIGDRPEPGSRDR